MHLKKTKTFHDCISRTTGPTIKIKVPLDCLVIQIIKYIYLLDFSRNKIKCLFSGHMRSSFKIADKPRRKYTTL